MPVLGSLKITRQAVINNSRARKKGLKELRTGKGSDHLTSIHHHGDMGGGG